LAKEKKKGGGGGGKGRLPFFGPKKRKKGEKYWSVKIGAKIIRGETTPLREGGKKGGGEKKISSTLEVHFFPVASPERGKRGKKGPED